MNSKQLISCVTGLPIQLESEPKLFLQQHSLKKIMCDIGYEEYNKLINILTMEVNDYMLQIQSETELYNELCKVRNELNTLFFITEFSQNINFKNEILRAFNVFLNIEQEKITFENDRILITLSENDIINVTQSILDEVKTMLLYLFFGKKKDSSDQKGSPQDDRVKALMEKMKRNREKVEQIKNQQTDTPNPRGLHDIISAITVRSNSINKFNILNLTLFQIFDEYKRLMKIDEYNLSLEALFNGGEVELQDWSEPI